MAFLSLGNTSTVNPLDMKFSTEVVVVITVISVLILVLDLVGNVSVIHIIRTRAHMRTSVNILVSNLAAADLLMIVVIAFLDSIFIRSGFRWFGGILGNAMCKTFYSLQAVSVFASVYSLLVIAIDRFYAVVLPLKEAFSTRKVKLVIVAIWMTSLAFASPQFLAASVVKLDDNYYCYSVWKDSGFSEQGYTIVFITLTYIIPLPAIATLYTVAVIKLWGSAVPGHQIEANQRKIRMVRRKATRMLIAIVVVFALCWLPLQTAEFLVAFMPNIRARLPLWVKLLLPWFGISNSAINPFIYVIFSENFRREFKRLFCRVHLQTDIPLT